MYGPMSDSEPGLPPRQWELLMGQCPGQRRGSRGTPHKDFTFVSPVPDPSQLCGTAGESLCCRALLSETGSVCPTETRARSAASGVCPLLHGALGLRMVDSTCHFPCAQQATCGQELLQSWEEAADKQHPASARMLWRWEVLDRPQGTQLCLAKLDL